MALASWTANFAKRGASRRRQSPSGGLSRPRLPALPRLVDLPRRQPRARAVLVQRAGSRVRPLRRPLLIVGLAPGLRGANRTGRPFTGDYAGDLLYPTLIEYGFARGDYRARVDDGLELVDCRIGNAVHCVPPENKPTPAEINTCRQFLIAMIGDMPQLRAIVALGRIAHDSTVKALGLRAAQAPFGARRGA